VQTRNDANPQPAFFVPEHLLAALPLPMAMIANL
jgi:hypothetical protein